MKPESTTATVLPTPLSPRPGPSADGSHSSPPPLDTDLAMRTMLLFQSLLERVVGERSEQEKRRSAPRRSYTPRSEAPLSQLAVPPSMSPRLRRRALHFSCPCCSRETVVIRRQAGTRIRCPHCYSPVVAPNPARRLSAHNLQRDIDTVLRPEAFAEAVRPMAPRWVRMIVKEPVLILAMASMVPFSAWLMLELPSVMDRAQGGVPTTVARVLPTPRVPGPADGASERAVALVQKFLAAPSVEAKAALVRDTQRVAPLMAALAAREPGTFTPVQASDLKSAGLSHYRDPANPVAVTPVIAQLPNGTQSTFLVEHTESGDVIEWESSIGYSEPLELAATARGKTPRPSRAVWRVEAAPDDYFNRHFSDEEALLCLRLTPADRPGEVFWAYAPKDGEIGAALRKIWNESPRDFAQRLTVTVEASPGAAKTRQVKLAAVNHAGWRTPDTQASLVAGTR